MSARVLAVFPLLLAVILVQVGCGRGEDRSQPASGETAQGAASPREPSDEELQTNLPELAAFHEVIFQLWHDAWPNKDYETMEALLPAVRDHVDTLAALQLPGIAQDKQEAWNAGILALKKSLGLYEEAVEHDDQEGLLLAVEQLHTSFENLARIMRPLMDELEDYHVELYRVYHYYLPDKNLLELRLTTAQMIDLCAALQEAAPPPDSGVDPQEFATAVAGLCQATGDLQQTAEGEDWDAIGSAVEDVHDRYQAIVWMFE